MQNLNKRLTRLNLLALVDCGLLTATQAMQELGITERHLRRLLRRFRKEGKHLRALTAGRRPRAWNGTPDAVVQDIIRLKKECPARSNQRIAEFATEQSGTPVSYSTVRNILIHHDCYEKMERARRVFQKMEDKITQSGQMLQMDTCEGAWLKGYRRVNLIAVMDAYSRFIVGWRWVSEDSAWNNIAVLRSVIEQYGVPEILYTDNASFFKVIRHNRSIYQRHKPNDAYETTIERIMLELGGALVTHKPYEPQGKGRIERFFEFMQGRFIAEHTATTLAELNRQFRRWLRWYHGKHVIRTIGCVPKDRLDARAGWRPVPEDCNLDRIFSFQYTRKVDKYNGFGFEGRHYVIDMDIDCFVAFTVQLCVTDTTIAVYYHDHLVQTFTRLPKNKS